MAAGIGAIAVGLSLSATYERRLERLTVEADQLRGLLALVRDPGSQVVTLAGLEPGAEVVTSGNFLVAAESRLASALDK